MHDFGNGAGIETQDISLGMFSIARVTNSLIANNATGVLRMGNSALLTGGGNSLVGNATAGSFSGSYAKQ